MSKARFVGPAGQLDYRNGHTAYAKTSVGKIGCVIFGPYETLEAGIYEVTFELTCDGEFCADGRDLGRVDIVGDRGRRQISSVTINSDYVKREGTTPIAVRFTIDRSTQLEYRLHSRGLHSFFVKYDREVKRVSNSVNADSAKVGGNSKFYDDNIDIFRKYSYLGAELTQKADGVILDWMGIKVSTGSQSDFQLIQEIFRHNAYNFVFENKTICVIDVGMNIGLASLYFAKMPSVGVVYSFEPFSRPYSKALENFSLNPQLALKIKPRQVGLAGKNEVITVRCSEEDTIGTSIRGSNGDLLDTITIQEASEALRPIIDGAFRRDEVVVLKLDCEGSEFAILESLDATRLLPHVSIVILEWHKWWSSDKSNVDIVRILSANGFFVFDLLDLDNPNASMIYAGRYAA